MASRIEDPSSLPGKDLFDQNGTKIGEIKDLYAIDGDGAPMWVTVESSPGVAGKQTIFVPLARMKEEDEQIRVPYSLQHVENAPEIEVEDEMSEECDRRLRDYYSIDHADGEVRTDNASYAAQVPSEGGIPKKVEDPDSYEGSYDELDEHVSAQEQDQRSSPDADSERSDGEGERSDREEDEGDEDEGEEGEDE